MNAIQIYPYTRGALYQVYSAPEQVTDIALEPGEELVSVSAGDSDLGVGWNAVSGGKNAQEYVRIVLDAPSFSEPVQAALFANTTGADLVWTRRSPLAG